MIKVIMKLIQNTGEFKIIGALKILNFVAYTKRKFHNQEDIIKTKLTGLLKNNNLIFIGLRAKDAFFTTPEE